MNFDIADTEELMAFCEDAWSDEVDPELLSQLAESTYGLGSFGWGEDDDLPDMGLDKMFAEEHGEIYSILGGDRNDFSCGFPLFRVLAAAHPKTPNETLHDLINDDDPEVLWALAGNPAAGDEILVKMIDRRVPLPDGISELADPELDDSRDRGIRYGTDQGWELSDIDVSVSVAGNRSCSPDLLDWFSQNSNADIAKALIMRNSDRLAEAQWRRLLEGTRDRDRSSTQRGWLQWIADSPNMPLSLVDDVLADQREGPILARRLARTASTPAQVLRVLIDRGVDEWTRTRIAGHFSATTEMLRDLAVDPSAQVRKAVVDNQLVNDEIKAVASLGG